MTKYLSPKLDFVFKMIFGDSNNADILEDFLLSVLRIPSEKISKITILDPNILLDNPEEKKSVLDLNVSLCNGQIVNVEIQVRSDAGVIPRLHYYKCKLVTEQVKSGESYATLSPVSCIAIYDYKMYDDFECHHRFRFYDVENQIEFSDYEELHMIELPKANLCNCNEKLHDWLCFLNAKSKEEFDILAEKNETVKKAVGVLAELSKDEAYRILAEAQEKEIHNQLSHEILAHKEGLQEGLKVGRREGRQEGRQEEKLNIGLNLLGMGFSITDIEKVTGLSESEIIWLKQL